MVQLIVTPIYRTKSQRSRSPGRLTSRPKISHIFGTGTFGSRHLEEAGHIVAAALQATQLIALSAPVLGVLALMVYLRHGQSNYCLVLQRNLRYQHFKSTCINKTFNFCANIAQKLNVFHQRCARKILHVTYRDHITNEVLLRTGSRKLADTVAERRFRMAGHILRLQSHRPSKVAISWD